MKSRYKIARRLLLFWCLFIGIGAVAGSIGMFVAPDGTALRMDQMLPYFQVLPFADILFQNFIFPGISLLIVNGLSNIIAAALLIMKKKLGIILGGILGFTLMLWICIQFYIFPMNFMSTIYFIFGMCQALTGLAGYIFYRQEKFAEGECKLYKEYNVKNENTDNKVIVVYFSRMGYTKHYAYEMAKKLNSDIYEVKSTENTSGTLGFWWCGRFGMHRWEMPIENVNMDFSKYDKVIICSPIWVFHICAPIRCFCKCVSGQVKKADYVLVHFQKAKYVNAFKEMDDLLGIKHDKATSICVRQGRELRRYEIN